MDWTPQPPMLRVAPPRQPMGHRQELEVQLLPQSHALQRMLVAFSPETPLLTGYNAGVTTPLRTTARGQQNRKEGSWVLDDLIEQARLPGLPTSGPLGQ